MKCDACDTTMKKNKVFQWAIQWKCPDCGNCRIQGKSPEEERFDW